MDGIDLAIIVIKVLIAFGLWLTGTALLIWGERRLVAKMQQRIGPNRLGPLGVAQTLADGVKLFFKEDIRPDNVDRVVYVLAPAVSAVVAILTFAVIPFGGTVTMFGRETQLQIWDPNIGLLWVLAMSSLAVYGITLAGWASGSKYPLLGGVRSTAQLISYELALGLGMAAVFIYTGSLQSSAIVANQSGLLKPIPFLPAFLPAWHVIPMLPAFFIFYVAAIAENQRPPFDLPEAEGELVAGFHTEYSAAKFAMFFLAEFMQVITMSAVTVTLFFGGPLGWVFGPDWLRAILPTIWFIAKIVVFVFVYVWLRATLPRFRYDRLMDLGWRLLLPLGLVWVMATGFSVVFRQTAAQGNAGRYALIGVVVAALLWLVAPMFNRRGDGATADGRTPPSAPQQGRVLETTASRTGAPGAEE